MEKIKEKQDQVDVVIVGTGVAGLFAALNLPRDFKIMMITKADLESSDSFLAQGGICVLRDESDYDSYFEDTMRAGHYENRKESVDIMIRSSQEIIRELIGYGVEFERRTEHSDDVIGDSDISRTYEYTREGAHSSPRILFHEDITGKEITGKLLARVKELDNVEIFEYTTRGRRSMQRRCHAGTRRNEPGSSLSVYDRCKRRNRRIVPSFHKFSAFDGRCS